MEFIIAYALLAVVCGALVLLSLELGRAGYFIAAAVADTEIARQASRAFIKIGRVALNARGAFRG